MRKTWKRALSYVLSAAMVLTAGVFAPADKTASAADINFTAVLNNNGGIYGWTTAPADAKVAVNALGEYSIKTTATADASPSGGAMWITMDGLDYTNLPTDYKIVGKSIKVNGKETEWKAEVDTEDNDVRLIIWNQWAETKNTVASDFSVKANDEIEFVFQVTDGSSTTPADPTTAPTDPVTPTDKLFTAEIGNNGGIWGWGGTPSTGDVWQVNVTGHGDFTLKTKATEDFSTAGGAVWIPTDLTAMPTDYAIVGKTVKVAGKEYDWSKATLYDDQGNIRLGVWNEWNDAVVCNPLGVDIEGNAGDEVEFVFSVVKPWFTASIANNGGIWGWGGTHSTGEAWQVAVAGYGDYTLKTTATEDYSATVGYLGVETDLTGVPTDYAIVGKTVKIAGKEYDWSKAALFDGGNYRLGVWNQWEEDETKKPLANPLGNEIEGSAGDEVELTFSVVEPQKPDDPVNPQPPVVTKKVLGTAKGKTFTAGNFKYKVATAATIEGTKKTDGKVTVVGLSSAGKKKSSISVKNIVSVKSTGASYKVTAIGSKAFKNASKLKSATLGTNIKSIPSSAFAGCKKLSKLSMKKTLSSVKKNSFKGCKKTIKVTGGSKKVNKANVKKLKKSGYKKFK